jgi:parallel beta-helix repeat protein
MNKRLIAAVVGLASALLLARLVMHVNAAATDFIITALDCTSTPGHITIQNQASAASDFGGLGVAITPTSSSAATLNVNATITPHTTDYVVPANGSVDLQVGSGATQSPPTAIPPAAPASVALSTTITLTPGTIVQLVDTGTGTPIGSPFSCPQTGGQFVLNVSPFGQDFIDQAQTVPNTQCGPDLAQNAPPTITNPGPCLTIQNALTYARDGDVILVESGTYEVCAPINVNKLVTITTNVDTRTGKDPNPATALAGSTKFRHVILHSFTGDTVFHVTSLGYPSVNAPGNFPNTVPSNIGANSFINNNFHTTIEGLDIGGAFKPGAAAIMLDNDAYTDVRFNTIGGEPISNPAFSGVPCAQPQPFPPVPPNPGFQVPPVQKSEIFGNANGIILSNSNHPNIFNNAVLGSSIFKFSPTLAIGDVQSGFGIITSECLGQGPDSSSGATIDFNAINRNLNAGIWLCSDGGGGHLINTNAVKNNGRGIVLRAVTDTLLDTNTVADSFADGIVIYEAASNNTVQKNLIESQNTPGSAGIRLGGFGGSLFPLQTAINNNTLRRNYIAIVIAGARNTTGTGNIITSEDTRTGILLQVGATGSPSITQPVGTVFNLNQIVFNGSCGAAQGCAIREDMLVTADMDATQNSFGLPARADVNSVLWHKLNDPALGFVSASQPGAVAVFATQTPGVGAPGAVGAGFVTSAPTPGPQGGPQNAGPVGAAAGAPAGFPTPQSGLGAPPGAAAPPGTSPSIATSPMLQGGPANGTSTYSPPCNLLTVPSTVGASISSALFLSQFQPVNNIFSAWRFNNASHVFQAIYFANPGAPVDAALLRPGDVVALCLTDNVTGPP